MYNGIGLQTPRGSGTNGYIQSNKFFVRPRASPSNSANTSSFSLDVDAAGGIKKPNKDLLEHDRKRQIEVNLLVLQETLADQGYTDSEISQKLDQARKDLEAKHLRDKQQVAPRRPPSHPNTTASRFSDTQTHQVAARKEKQLEVLRAALGIKHPEELPQSEVQEQKPEKDETSSVNEDSDSEGDNHKKKDSEKRGSMTNQNEDFNKGNQLAEDSKPLKDSKKEEKQWEKNRDDGKGIKAFPSKEIRKGGYGYSSDSDYGGRHEKKGKDDRDTSTGLESEEDFGNSSKNAAKKVVVNARHVHSNVNKRSRHDTDSDSNSDEKQFRKKRNKNRRYDSDDSGSDDDYQKKTKKKMETELRKYSRSKTTDSDSDGGRKYQKHEKKHDRGSRRQDSGSDHEYRREIARKTEFEQKKYGKNQEPSDSDSDSVRKFRKHGGNINRHDSGSDDDYQKKGTRKMEFEREKHGRWQNTADSDTDSGRHGRKHDRDSKRHDSRDKRDKKAEVGDEKRDTAKGMEKMSKPSSRSSRGHGTDERGKIDERYEKSNRRMDAAFAEEDAEDTRRKRHRHDTDDESSDRKDGRRSDDTRRKRHRHGTDGRSSDRKEGGRTR